MKRSNNIIAFSTAVAVSTVSGASTIVAQDIGVPTGYLSFGAAYSQLYGETVFASLVEDDLLGSGVGVDLTAEYSQSGYRISGNLDTDVSLSIPGFAADPFLDISVYLDEHNWQGDAYSSKRLGVDAALVFPVQQNMIITTGVFYYDDTISNVSANTSPIVASDAGQTVTAGAQIGVNYSNLDTPVRPSEGMSFGINAQYAGISGDANWTSVTASGSVYKPLPKDGVVKFGAIAGQMRSLDGNAVSITERAFLGYDLPRGFAFGGLGPRDDDGADVNTSLGGESYAAFNVQADFPISSTSAGTFYGGVFWDAGSVWGLTGAPVGASGVIDDAMYWRASYGASLAWVGNMGQVRISLANPYQIQPGDIVQPLSISFTTAF